MPKNAVAVLSLSCGATLTAYIALIIATVFFASLQTGFAHEAREAESRIAALETEYYDAIDRLSGADLALRGLHEPRRVEYVSLGGAPSFTRADP